jgi:hypothetical protein
MRGFCVSAIYRFEENRIYLVGGGHLDHLAALAGHHSYHAWQALAAGGLGRSLENDQDVAGPRAGHFLRLGLDALQVGELAVNLAADRVDDR